MFKLKNKPNDVWSWIDVKTGDVRYEDGTTEPLELHHILLDFWKFRGTPLSEIDDIGALQFMLKVAEEKAEVFTQHMLIKRINQLEI